MNNEEIKQVIEKFIGYLGVRVDSIEIVREGENHAVFFIHTNDSKVLIGPGGEHLKSLNMLVKIIATRGTEQHANFLIDVNGYYSRHISEVKKNAKTLADRVRMFHAPIELSPMNAYDRMLVHSAFADDPEIETASEGEGKYRRVVLKYKQWTA
jgi:spoIIIJ-associated protein